MNEYCALHEAPKEMKDFHKCHFCDASKHKKKLIFFTVNYFTFDGCIGMEVWDNKIICKGCWARLFHNSRALLPNLGEEY